MLSWLCNGILVKLHRFVELLEPWRWLFVYLKKIKNWQLLNWIELIFRDIGKKVLLFTPTVLLPANLTIQLALDECYLLSHLSYPHHNRGLGKYHAIFKMYELFYILNKQGRQENPLTNSISAAQLKFNLKDPDFINSKADFRLKNLEAHTSNSGKFYRKKLERGHRTTQPSRRKECKWRYMKSTQIRLLSLKCEIKFTFDFRL